MVQCREKRGPFTTWKAVKYRKCLGDTTIGFLFLASEIGLLTIFYLKKKMGQHDYGPIYGRN